jgi:alkylhydroperoxidase/carboxymuconolactone decarboxylase family protein YurZ
MIAKDDGKGVSMAEKSWGELIRDLSPDLDAQNRADLEYLARDTALSAREKYLIAMVLDSAANKPGGARSYGEKAVHAGASKEQVLEALTVLRMFCGRPVLATGCEALRQFDKG